MKTIAVCVMSHNHPETVAHVLENAVEIYKACEVDVYYYDSSDDDETKNIIEEYVCAGYDNLFYIPCRGVDAVVKQSMILSRRGQKYDYDYIWLVKDRTFLESQTILSVYREALFEKPDYIIIDSYSERTDAITKNYTDCGSFYRDYAWEVTSMDVTLYGRRVLENVKQLDEIFQTDNPLRYFWHFDLIFRRASELDNLKISVISDPLVRILNSNKSGSGWAEHVFNIWVNNWTKENERLPDVYEQYSHSVMKSAAVPDILKRTDTLINLKKAGILTEEVLKEGFFERWSKVSDIPADVVRDIAEGKI